MSERFSRGQWTVTVTDEGRVAIDNYQGAHVPALFEISALDLRAALGQALEAIQQRHGHTLSEIEAQIDRDTVRRFDLSIAARSPGEATPGATPEPPPIQQTDRPSCWDLVIADMQLGGERRDASPPGAYFSWSRGGQILMSGGHDGVGSSYDAALWHVVNLGQQLGYEHVDRIILDMRARDDFGRAKYGTPLQPGNGRNAVVDAYQEALDLAVYLRQALYERDGK